MCLKYMNYTWTLGRSWLLKVLLDLIASLEPTRHYAPPQI